MNDQRIAVVTGANRGIGLAACEGLGARGYKVVLGSRDDARGEAAAATLREAGHDVVAHRLDVDDPASIARLGDWVRAELGRCDALVNNAGIFTDPSVDDEFARWDAMGEASALRARIDTIRENMETHAYGPLLLCQALAPLMLEAGYGRVVNVSSGWGQFHQMGGGMPGYRLAKAALNAVTKLLSVELVGTGVLINAMCPGWVRTDMGGEAADRSPAEGADTAVWLATLPDDGPTGALFRDRAQVPW